jgi:LysM repeat protein
MSATRGWRSQAKRYAAPVAFLLAVTIAVLLVRSALRTDPAPVETTRLTRAVATTAGKQVPPRRRRYYRLRAGETLSDVALKFNTTVAQLVVLNPRIRPTGLVPGQRVRVK